MAQVLSVFFVLRGSFVPALKWIKVQGVFLFCQVTPFCRNSWTTDTPFSDKLIARKPTAEVNVIDHFATVEYSTGKPRTLTLLWTKQTICQNTPNAGNVIKEPGRFVIHTQKVELLVPGTDAPGSSWGWCPVSILYLIWTKRVFFVLKRNQNITDLLTEPIQSNQDQEHQDRTRVTCVCPPKEVCCASVKAGDDNEYLVLPDVMDLTERLWDGPWRPHRGSNKRSCQC